VRKTEVRIWDKGNEETGFKRNREGRKIERTEGENGI